MASAVISLNGGSRQTVSLPYTIYSNYSVIVYSLNMTSASTYGFIISGSNIVVTGFPNGNSFTYNTQNNTLKCLGGTSIFSASSSGYSNVLIQNFNVSFYGGGQRTYVSIFGGNYPITNLLISYCSTNNTNGSFPGKVPINQAGITYTTTPELKATVYCCFSYAALYFFGGYILNDNTAGITNIGSNAINCYNNSQMETNESGSSIGGILNAYNDTNSPTYCYNCYNYCGARNPQGRDFNNGGIVGVSPKSGSGGVNLNITIDNCYSFIMNTLNYNDVIPNYGIVAQPVSTPAVKISHTYSNAAIGVAPVVTNVTSSITTNSYTWVDATANSVLTGYPTSRPGIGTVWYSTSTNSPYYLCSFYAPVILSITAVNNYDGGSYQPVSNGTNYDYSTMVTITGINFSGTTPYSSQPLVPGSTLNVTKIYFGSIQCTEYTINSSTSITCKAPPFNYNVNKNTSSTVSITLVNEYGTSLSSFSSLPAGGTNYFDYLYTFTYTYISVNYITDAVVYNVYN
jgi:hypothetical protein